ncbi:DEAD/DEAH box helicase [Undibacterium squillarum]|uniref:DEAD/DEAH box helicase n=1 Tax=Undibacterium squillarum TaxID=1131567 RepID=UPI0035ADB004
MSFSQLGLSTPLQNAAQQQGFTQPTPVQSEVIPSILAGKDVLASAQTGSGKTAAYCLPVLEWHLQRKATTPKTVHTLILVPTRELAVQVGDTLRTLSKSFTHYPKLAVLFGGISINPQMLHLRGGADIVVATPGRLLDLVQQNALRLDQVERLVLDEADRMLALGFAEELNAVLKLLPAQRQHCFFSATFSDSIRELAHTLLRDPVKVNIPTTEEGKPDILQRAILVDAKQRTQLLKHLYTTEKWSRVLVFVATKYSADLIATKLRRLHISAEALHGEQTQGKRMQVLSDFKDARVKIVIATDVAARGIDISQLPVVVNFDLPRSSEDYTHRIGRTGRAGEAGMAVSFICADAANEAHFRLIEKRHGVRIEREQVAGFEISPETLEQVAHAKVSDPNGGVKGKRPSKKDKLRALAAQAEKNN